jgi:hypothetical protein
LRCAFFRRRCSRSGAHTVHSCVPCRSGNGCGQVPAVLFGELRLGLIDIRKQAPSRAACAGLSGGKSGESAIVVPSIALDSGECAMFTEPTFESGGDASPLFLSAAKPDEEFLPESSGLFEQVRTGVARSSGPGAQQCSSNTSGLSPLAGPCRSKRRSAWPVRLIPSRRASVKQLDRRNIRVGEQADALGRTPPHTQLTQPSWPPPRRQLRRCRIARATRWRPTASFFVTTACSDLVAAKTSAISTASTAASSARSG